jgi:hypothetical protein
LSLPIEYSNLVDNLSVHAKRLEILLLIYTIVDFYIYSFKEIIEIHFHIENDIMLYMDIHELSLLLDKPKIHVMIVPMKQLKFNVFKHSRI